MLQLTNDDAVVLRLSERTDKEKGDALQLRNVAPVWLTPLNPHFMNGFNKIHRAFS
jgi:hypothetical protein